MNPQLADITKRAQELSASVGTLDRASKAGYKVDSTTTVEGAEKFLANLPVNGAPTKANEFNPMGSMNMPSLVPSSGNPTPAAASAMGIAQGLSSGQDYLKSILPLLQAQYQSQSENRAGFEDNMVAPSQARAGVVEQLQAAGIAAPTDQLKNLQEAVTEVATLKGQYDLAEAQKIQELENLRATFGGTTEGLTQAMTAAERNANFRLLTLSAQVNAKTAYAQALKGNYDASMNFIDQTVQDVKENNDFYYKLFTATESQNKEIFNNLSQAYKDAWTVAKEDANILRQEKNDRLDALRELAGKVTDPSVVGAIAGMMTKPNLSEADVARAYELAAPSLSSGGGLTTYQQMQMRNQIEDNLRQNTAVKAYTELVNFGVPQVLEQYYEGTADNVADTVLMRSLAKVTDPTTGVREEEYRTFEDAQGALNRIYNMPKSWVGKGRLTETGRAAMIREIERRYNSRLDEYNDQYGYYADQAERSGVTIPPSYQAAQTPFKQEIPKEKEDVFDEVTGGSAQSSSWIVNLWNSLF